MLWIGEVIYIILITGGPVFWETIVELNAGSDVGLWSDVSQWTVQQYELPRNTSHT